MVQGSISVHIHNLVTRLSSITETEQTWAQINSTLALLQAKVTPEVGCHPEFTTCLEKLAVPLSGFVQSDRTILSNSAVMLVKHLVEVTGKAFALLSRVVLPALVAILGRTSSIYRTRGSSCLSAIIKARPSPIMIQVLCAAVEGMSSLARPHVVGLIKEMVSKFPKSMLLYKQTQLEEALKRGARDPKADIRKLACDAVVIYYEHFPQRRVALLDFVPATLLSTRSPSSPRRSPHLQRTPPNALNSQLSPSQLARSQPIPPSRTLIVNHRLPDYSHVVSRINCNKPIIQEVAVPPRDKKPGQLLPNKKILSHKIPTFSHVRPRVNSFSRGSSSTSSANTTVLSKCSPATKRKLSPSLTAESQTVSKRARSQEISLSHQKLAAELNLVSFPSASDFSGQVSGASIALAVDSSLRSLSPMPFAPPNSPSGHRPILAPPLPGTEGSLLVAQFFASSVDLQRAHPQAKFLAPVDHQPNGPSPTDNGWPF